jgi:membrane-associated phospholipid phosphatase
MLEKPLMLDLHKYDGLVRLGDVEDDYNLPYLGSPTWDRPFENLGRMTVQDWGHGAGALGNSSAWQYALIGTGAVLGSAVLDRRVSRFVDRHSGSHAMETADSLGKGLPVGALFGAGLAALSEQDKRLSNTGLAAVQAGATGLLANVGIKYAVGRARPVDELGPGDFEPFKRSDASFPSNHATVMWAAVTPFAREYDAPWLYGLAALTNVGRIASREHWLSDTVASSLLGFAIGDFFWEQRRKPDDKGPKVGVGPAGVTLTWETK